MNQTTRDLVYLSAIIASAHVYNSCRENSSLIGREALLPAHASPWSKLYEVLRSDYYI